MGFLDLAVGYRIIDPDKTDATLRFNIEVHPGRPKKGALEPGKVKNMGDIQGNPVPMKKPAKVLTAEPMRDLKTGLKMNELGVALMQQGKVAEAIAAFRRAIKLDPSYQVPYYNLGGALLRQRKVDEAAAAFRRAIELKPDYALAYKGLGDALKLQVRFADSLWAYRRCHELGSKEPGWSHPSAKWVRDAERLAAKSQRAKPKQGKEDKGDDRPKRSPTEADLDKKGKR
jgi:tetratricopeptide (TPR) repeat protein